MSNLQAEEYKSFEEYAEFQNAGYMGLYGGLTVNDIHKKRI